MTVAIELAPNLAKCHVALVNPRWKNGLQRGAEAFRPALPYLPAALVSAWLAHKSISGILDRTGHPTVPLDDAFIHFQYARNLASGQFFHYVPDAGYVAGATSMLWPLFLAPFYLIGFSDLSIIWVAWLLGFAAFAGLLVEVFRLAEKLTGPAVALSASAMCALFGGFIWFAASGMETIPLAWGLLRAARLACIWCEASQTQKTNRLRNELIALAWLVPLLRPEGALASVFAAVALIGRPEPCCIPHYKAAVLRLAPLAGPLLMPLTHLLMTGSASSNTTKVKWLPMSPYYPNLSSLWEPVSQNLRLMFSTIVDGQQWSAVFLPSGALPIAVGALVAIPVAGWRYQKPWRALFIGAIALAMFIPCTYHTFLWNRLRYLWPFAPAWFIGVACMAKLIGDALGVIRPRWALIAPVLGAICAGSFLGNLKWTLTDLSKSAAAIDLQQVALGRWARNNLPQNATIGVNDTGAIAYFSNRPTFDVVGLTTPGEAPYWVAGAGSRFEHYERLYQTDRKRLPTHFIVYPNWMQCDEVLGKRLHEASVYDQSILGGVTMVAYEARYDLLNSAARPIEQKLAGTLIDELDVADLESEAAHGYEINLGAGREASNRVHRDNTRSNNWKHEAPTRPIDPGDRLEAEEIQQVWADGGRFLRYADRFVAHLKPDVATQAVARWVGPDDGEVQLVVESGSRVLAMVTMGAHVTREVAFSIPPDVAAEQTPILVRAVNGSTFGSLHYWFAIEPE